ncbi:hypothetical protein PRK78_006383 [Emydomyces testavorans]|uniref:Uncharacterized protein n=1 Tax=Emydomyces testavorans TaxID=2070801 RepID=A0AAF0IKF1_9EURO|nr:hypothetical protein PRK78_006383 [Emydomyces testavorans]
MCWVGGDFKKSHKTPKAHDGKDQNAAPRIPLRPRREMMTPGTISPGDLGNVSRVINHRLKGNKYAFIGGVACSLLGSTRATHDFDIVVPNGTKDKILSTLAKDKSCFGTAEGGIWVRIDHRRYNLDIIEPKQIGQTFDGHEVVDVRGVKVLKPEKLLDYKRDSYETRDRARVQSLDNDVRDIAFLNEYLTERS